MRRCIESLSECVADVSQATNHRSKGQEGASVLLELLVVPIEKVILCISTFVIFTSIMLL